MPQTSDHAPDHLPKTRWQRVSLLRMSLAGESTAMLLMFHAGCSAVVWGLAAPASACGLGLVTGAIWLGIRTTGALSGSWMTPLTTAVFAVTVFSIARSDLSNLLPFLILGPFSPNVLFVILTAMFFVDLTDCWLQFRRRGR